MTLTKETMIERIKTDDEWLNRAVLRIATVVSNNQTNINIDDKDRYDLDYWSGWIRTKRNLTGEFRVNAVKLVTSNECINCLWDYAVTNKGDNK